MQNETHAGILLDANAWQAPATVLLSLVCVCVLLFKLYNDDDSPVCSYCADASRSIMQLSRTVQLFALTFCIPNSQLLQTAARGEAVLATAMCHGSSLHRCGTIRV